MPRKKEKTSERPEGFRPQQRKRRPCSLCINKVDKVDYKDFTRLRKYMTERGKILPPRVTGACAKHMRLIAKALKRARNIGLLPYTVD